MKRTQIERYEQEAEKAFSNYYGDEGFDEFGNEGYDDEDYDEDYDDEDYDDYEEDYDEDFSGATATPVNRANRRYLTFRIKNNNTDVSNNPIQSDVTLFGAYGSYAPNPKVLITLDEGDYSAFLSEIAANPYTLIDPRYRVKSATQYANSFEIKKIEASGQTSSHRVQPQNFEDPRNNTQNLILMSGFGMVADGRSSLSFKMEAGEEISIAFEIAARVNNSLLLSGGSAAPKMQQPKKGGCGCKNKGSRGNGGRGGNRNGGGGGSRRRRND